MIMEVKERFLAACEYLREFLILRTPVDTGNLAHRGIHMIFINKHHARIIIGGEAAPYAIFTNSPWTSPKWNGKTNPNQGWVEDAVKDATGIVKQILGGNITQEEYEELLLHIMGTADKRIAELKEIKHASK